MTGISDLAAHDGEPERPRSLERLRHLILENRSIILSSRDAGRHRGSVRLGLAGAVHPEVAALEQPLRFGGSPTTRRGLGRGSAERAACNFTYYSNT